MHNRRFGMISEFISAAERHASRPALDVEDTVFTYAQLSCMAQVFADSIRRHGARVPDAVAIMPLRTKTAFAGMLGVLATGRCYVPINALVPPQRAVSMLNDSRATALVTDDTCIDFVEQVLADVKERHILFHAGDVGRFSLGLRVQHVVVEVGDPTAGSELLQVDTIDPARPAYILYTSGSTGRPKGVALTHNNALAYFRNARHIADIRPEDVSSQYYDISFDFPLQETFMAWNAGACVAVVPQRALSNPAGFLRRKRVTVFCALPSLILIMARMRTLGPGSFPDIRHSIISGEPFPLELLKLWETAAPNSVIYNCYGLTEATTMLTEYRWRGEESLADVRNGIVSIGTLFDSQCCMLVDDKGEEVRKGEIGEMCFSGSQVGTGYLNDPERSAARFTTLPDGGNALWYKAGDLACYGDDGLLYYHGRKDQQVKIRGYRAELQEIEHAVQQVSGATQVVVIPWPVRDGVAENVHAFLTGVENPDTGLLQRQCAEMLPAFMIPAAFHTLDALPVTQDRGKIDRKRLQQLLEDADGA